MVVVPAVATFRNTSPSPRVCDGVAAPPWPAGATTSNSAMAELNGPHKFGALNGVNGVLETDWKPLSDTAIFGPRSSPHGCSRLRAGAITSRRNFGRAGIAPVERDLVPCRVAISAALLAGRCAVVAAAGRGLEAGHRAAVPTPRSR